MGHIWRKDGIELLTQDTNSLSDKDERVGEHAAINHFDKRQ